MPGYFGQKRSMKYLLVPNLVAQYLLTYGSFSLKPLGFFLNGLFHIKNTICYTTLFDFLPDRHKNKGSTFINFFDLSCLILSNVFLRFFKNDT